MPDVTLSSASGKSGRDRAAAPGAARFPQAGGTSVLPPRQPRRRRAAYVALDTINRLIPKRSDKVVLHSTIDLEDGILAVVEELHQRGWASTVLLEDPGRAAQVRAHTGGRVRTVPKKSLRGVLHFITARFVMTTENVYGDREPPSSQVVVNIWHGEPPTKIIARFFPGQGGLHCTYAPVMSTVGRAYRSAEFGLDPLRVPIVGAPRNDRMLRADGDAVRRALLAEDAHLPAYFWLPSFRTGSWAGRTRSDVAASHPGVPFAAEDVQRLDDWLSDHDARVVVKLHPHDVADFRGDFRAIRVLTQEEMQSRGLTLYTLLSAFDGLLTDVSSIWLDYLLLDKPMVFPFPDLQDYRDGRGLNLEPYEDWVPGPLVRDLDGLLAALSDLVQGRDAMATERRLARRRFHQYHDDKSTARLLDGLGICSR
ncbi:MAG: CDP-glycerol glycerophosphotransferase family protein [Actinomycetota bacterium]|nr:CDP-glycerol glycerophosphotransferase family protein [Actinomycetota bacterium]